MCIEKDYIADELVVVKRKISNTSRANPYGKSAATLMKEKMALRKQFNSIELSLKVLKRDAQARIQADWEIEQAETRRKSEGSYNCLGGC